MLVSSTIMHQPTYYGHYSNEVWTVIAIPHQFVNGNLRTRRRMNSNNLILSIITHWNLPWNGIDLKKLTMMQKQRENWKGMVNRSDSLAICFQEPHAARAQLILFNGPCSGQLFKFDPFLMIISTCWVSWAGQVFQFTY